MEGVQLVDFFNVYFGQNSYQNFDQIHLGENGWGGGCLPFDYFLLLKVLLQLLITI